jgi:hypothetical protein
MVYEGGDSADDGAETDGAVGAWPSVQREIARLNIAAAATIVNRLIDSSLSAWSQSIV